MASSSYIELRDKFNLGLNSIKADGSYYAIIKAYKRPDLIPQHAAVKPY